MIDENNQKFPQTAKRWLTVELVMNHVLKCEFGQAIKYASFLSENPFVSKGACTYIEAVVRYAKSIDDGENSDDNMIFTLFK